jgi:hypothetical protein
MMVTKSSTAVMIVSNTLVSREILGERPNMGKYIKREL